MKGIVDVKLPLTGKLEREAASEASEIFNRGAANFIVVSLLGVTRAIRIFELETNNNSQHATV